MNKFLYLVWYEEKNNILNLIAKLTYKDNMYIFEYLNFETSELQLFSKNGLFYGFEDINEIYKSNNLFPTILNRLPSKKRIDYNKIMLRYGLDLNSTEYEILEKTKGALSTDYFIFITEEEYIRLKTNKTT